MSLGRRLRPDGGEGHDAEPVGLSLRHDSNLEKEKKNYLRWFRLRCISATDIITLIHPSHPRILSVCPSRLQYGSNCQVFRTCLILTKVKTHKLTEFASRLIVLKISKYIMYTCVVYILIKQYTYICIHLQFVIIFPSYQCQNEYTFFLHVYLVNITNSKGDAKTVLTS